VAIITYAAAETHSFSYQNLLIKLSNNQQNKQTFRGGFLILVRSRMSLKRNAYMSSVLETSVQM